MNAATSRRGLGEVLQVGEDRLLEVAFQAMQVLAGLGVETLVLMNELVAALEHRVERGEDLLELFDLAGTSGSRLVHLFLRHAESIDVGLAKCRVELGHAASQSSRLTRVVDVERDGDTLADLVDGDVLEVLKSSLELPLDIGHLVERGEIDDPVHPCDLQTHEAVVEVGDLQPVVLELLQSHEILGPLERLATLFPGFHRALEHDLTCGDGDLDVEEAAQDRGLERFDLGLALDALGDHVTKRLLLAVDLRLDALVALSEGDDRNEALAHTERQLGRPRLLGVDLLDLELPLEVAHGREQLVDRAGVLHTSVADHGVGRVAEGLEIVPDEGEQLGVALVGQNALRADVVGESRGLGHPLLTVFTLAHHGEHRLLAGLERAGVDRCDLDGRLTTTGLSRCLSHRLFGSGLSGSFRRGLGIALLGHLGMCLSLVTHG